MRKIPLFVIGLAVISCLPVKDEQSQRSSVEDVQQEIVTSKHDVETVSAELLGLAGESVDRYRVDQLAHKEMVVKSVEGIYKAGPVKYQFMLEGQDDLKCESEQGVGLFSKSKLTCRGGTISKNAETASSGGEEVSDGEKTDPSSDPLASGQGPLGPGEAEPESVGDTPTATDLDYAIPSGTRTADCSSSRQTLDFGGLSANIDNSGNGKLVVHLLSAGGNPDLPFGIGSLHVQFSKGSPSSFRFIDDSIYIAGQSLNAKNMKMVYKIVGEDIVFSLRDTVVRHHIAVLRNYKTKTSGTLAPLDEIHGGCLSQFRVPAGLVANGAGFLTIEKLDN